MPVVRQNRTWLSIPLRCDTNVEFSGSGYYYDGSYKHMQETVIGFHNTRLERLVEATKSWTGDPMGNGILVDGRLRYGCCTHSRPSGVNVFSDGGLETFNGSTGWVQLEVCCTNTVRLRGGRIHPYCVPGTYGEVCEKAALVALWIPNDEVPPMVALSI